MNEVEDLYFTQYLNETKKHIKGKFTTLKWLQFLDGDTLKMLQTYFDNFYERPVEDIDDNQSADIISLVTSIVKLEIDINPEQVNQKLIQYVQCFVALTVMESLSRKKLVSIYGDGKITSDNTTFEITGEGKLITEAMSQCLLD